MAEADVRESRRFSAVWIVPIAALLIGAWTLVQNYLSQGPQIYITFATAEGLVAGETQVKTLDVQIGVVENVELADDFSSVTAMVRLRPKAASLLTDDAQFWVVRPRVGSQGISGLSTILSGAYIQLAPGAGVAGKRRYRGLDEMPLTPPSTPGLQVQLLADNASSLSAGSPVLYNGYRVGRIEESNLDPDTGQSRYTAFIDEPYDGLVTTATRFWNASGIAMSLAADGFSVRTQSLETLLTGGVTFGTPEGARSGQVVQDGALFFLFNDEASLSSNPYLHANSFLLQFDSSIRGLEVGAPVEYRGMRIGTVMDVGLQDVQWNELWKESSSNQIPVLVDIEPGWLGEDSAAAADAFTGSLGDAVDQGLRASLAMGNLLTGGLYVSLDFYTDAEPAKLLEREEAWELPTIASGLDQIEHKVAKFLSKLQSLPLDETLDITNSALRETQATVVEAKAAMGALTALLASPDVAELSPELVATLGQAQTVLASFGPQAALQEQMVDSLRRLNQVITNANEVLDTYDEKPNAFIFPSKKRPDVVPRAAPGGE